MDSGDNLKLGLLAARPSPMTTSTDRFEMHATCKIGKLSLIAGAELPKKYLAP